MFEYRCRVCKARFEADIVQTRCTTFKCQSRQIKDTTPTYKGPTYSDFEWGFDNEGVKTEIKRDKQGQQIRQDLARFMEELENARNQSGPDG